MRRRSNPRGVAPLAVLVTAGWVAAVGSPAHAAPVPAGPTPVDAPAAVTAEDDAARSLAGRAAALRAARAGASTALSLTEQARGALLLGSGTQADVARAERGWHAAAAAVRTLEVLVELDRAVLSAAVAARAAGTTTGPGAYTGLLAASGGSADLRALQAVSFALAQLGDPYRWGSTGPHTWDCSSLVQAAYRSAGVAIPRTSRQQALVGQRVARADLLPGDLVVLARDPGDLRTVHHVGMYLGDGMWVHAPRTGDVVKVGRVPVSGYAGAVRVVPATGTPPAPPAPTDLPVPVPAPTPTPTPTPEPEPEPEPTPSPTPTPTPTPDPEPADPPTDPPTEPPTEPVPPGSTDFLLPVVGGTGTSAREEVSP